MAKIVSINKSEKRGTLKVPCDVGFLEENIGLRDDAHADGTHRQLSLLACESYDEMYKLGADPLPYGVFAENITAEGIELHTLPVGTKLQIGACEVEVTQIGKECHHGCEIFKKVGTCVMPKQGIFARILKGGEIKIGDKIKILINEK